MTQENFKGRQPKFYNELPNKNIRKYLAEEGLKNKDFAEKINTALSLQRDEQEKPATITVEAVRQWVEGYSRPDLRMIPILAEVMDCTADYLLGISTMTNKEEELIFKTYKLSPKASEILASIMYRNAQTEDDESRLLFLSDLIESKKFSEIASKYHEWKKLAFDNVFSETNPSSGYDKEFRREAKKFEDLSKYEASLIFERFFSEQRRNITLEIAKEE